MYELTPVPEFTMEGRFAFILSFLTLGAGASMAVGSPVKVSVFFESLCPDSRNFITSQLYPVWQKLRDIIELDIHAYGKTTELRDGEDIVFHCQHGPRECAGNAMLTCAKKYIDNLEQFLDFVNCVMRDGNGAMSGSMCADESGVDFTDIARCHNTSEGADLQHSIGLRQQQLEPSLYYVPWIIINDVFTKSNLKESQINLKKIICDTYEGEDTEYCTHEH